MTQIKVQSEVEGNSSPEDSAVLDERVQELKRAGEHIQAAELLLTANRYEDAGLLFEQVFELERA